MTQNKKNWYYASWEGSRILLLRKSLLMTPKERFYALETISEVSNWLKKSHKAGIQTESKGQKN